jgi:RNA polymerase sigma-70 factor (ECF subfamily)
LSPHVDRTRRLVQEARAGCREAFDELFSSQRPRLERALRGRVPRALAPRVDVSDIVQAALLDAYRGLERFEDRGEGSFVRWLRRVAENRLRMELGRHLGRARRELGREVSPERSLERAASVTSPSSAAGRGERGEIVARALARLHPDHREVLRCVRVEGRSIAEAARAMGRSENAVKKLLARASLELASRLPRSAQP